MKRFPLALAVGALALFSSADSHAGAQVANSFSCAEYQTCHYDIDFHQVVCDYVGYVCSGTLSGARNSADATAYAQFMSHSAGSTTFGARYNGTYYACSATPAQKPYWPVTIGARGYFSIQMDYNGNCTGIAIYNSSQYTNY